MKNVLSPRQILPRVFFLSGFSSLLFQVAYQRLLTLYWGVGPVSVTLIVSIYMLGLGVGGWLGGVIADKTQRPFIVYLIVELTLATFGVLSLPYLSMIATATAGTEGWLSLLSLSAFLLVPTVAMGMTLPLVIKLFNRQAHDFLGSVSYLYSVNTMGAATGALAGAFLLISFAGLDWTIYTGSAIDALLVLLIYMCLRMSKSNASIEALADDSGSSQEPDTDRPGWHAYPAVFVTGLLAIGYELIWFRFLQVLIKSSPYAFAVILAVYLVGIAIGSQAMKSLVERYTQLDRRSLFFSLQVTLAVLVALSIGIFYHGMDSLFNQLLLTSWYSDASSWLARVPFLFLLVWPLLFVLTPTILMGASFPLITSLAHDKNTGDGQAVGTTYFFNTFGNVTGGLLTGFVFLPVLGTESTLLIFSIVGIIMALFVEELPGGKKISFGTRIGCIVGLVALTTACLPGKGELYRKIHQTASAPERTPAWTDRLKEGLAGVVVIHQCPPDYMQVVINGLGHGRRPDYKYYREIIEALAYAHSLDDVLVIGFGGGSTAETVLKLPEVKKMTIVEINDALLSCVKDSKFFQQTVFADRRVTTVEEDCRRFLLTTKDKYDLVTLDPLRTREAYSNNIYSRQFMELVKSHLKENGVVLFWLDEHHVLPKTIASVFPHVRLYNFFCLASTGPFAENSQVRKTLRTTFSPEQLQKIDEYKTDYLGDREYTLSSTKQYPTNEDLRPITEYYLNLALY